MPKSLFKLTLALLCVVALAACADKSKPTPGISGGALGSGGEASSSSSATESEGPSIVTVLAVESGKSTYVFDTAGVERVDAGPLKITFSNSAFENDHELRIVRVRDGDFDAYRSAVAAEGEAGGAALADEIAATPAIGPGESASLDVTLEPGTYALVSFLPAADGKVDAQLGMVRELDVSP